MPKVAGACFPVGVNVTGTVTAALLMAGAANRQIAAVAAASRAFMVYSFRFCRAFRPAASCPIAERFPAGTPVLTRQKERHTGSSEKCLSVEQRRRCPGHRSLCFANLLSGALKML